MLSCNICGGPSRGAAAVGSGLRWVWLCPHCYAYNALSFLHRRIPSVGQAVFHLWEFEDVAASYCYRPGSFRGTRRGIARELWRERRAAPLRLLRRLGFVPS